MNCQNSSLIDFATAEKVTPTSASRCGRGGELPLRRRWLLGGVATAAKVTTRRFLGVGGGRKRLCDAGKSGNDGGFGEEQTQKPLWIYPRFADYGYSYFAADAYVAVFFTSQFRIWSTCRDSEPDYLAS